MNLRRQLLVVSLLLLSLPWAGCQFVREMESALRQGQEQSLEATTQAVATVLGNQPSVLYPHLLRLDEAPEPHQSIYAMPHHESVFVDGYADGWEGIEPHTLSSPASSSGLKVQYRAVTHSAKLYLLIDVVDTQVVYHNPGLSLTPNGDRLLIRTWHKQSVQDYVIATAAPGKVRARATATGDSPHPVNAIQGQWQDSIDGYTLELEIPLSATGGRLGFAVVDVRSPSGETHSTVGNFALNPRNLPPPWLIDSPTRLRDAIAPFAKSGRQLSIIDKHGWQLAHTPYISTRASSNDVKTFWLLRMIYRSILSGDQSEPRQQSAINGQPGGKEVEDALLGTSSHQRYRDPAHRNRAMLAAAMPIYHGDEVIGAVVLKESGEQYLTLTDQAFSRLLGYSLAALLIGLLGLLSYASLLSWRIRSLSNAASEAAQQDDFKVDNFPRSRAADEIGELSRSYADLLDKLRQYNDYLRSLSSKLSHELRTPIAVVQTSLENLEQHHHKDDSSTIYLTRANTGLARLSHILSAMSEASGMADSIEGHRLSPLDLTPFISGIFGAYQATYSTHKLILECTSAPAQTLACADLLAQALDKLMDNAISFTPPGGGVTLKLVDAGDTWLLGVSNDGPLLPTSMDGELFNSMVSVREKGAEDVHLGLGLHIASLIAKFHAATLTMTNRQDGTGVECTLTLPKHSDSGAY